MTEPYHSAYTSLVDAPVRRSRISVRDVANYSRKQQLLLNITPLQLLYKNIAAWTLALRHITSRYAYILPSFERHRSPFNILRDSSQ